MRKSPLIPLNFSQHSSRYMLFPKAYECTFLYWMLSSFNHNCWRFKAKIQLNIKYSTLEILLKIVKRNNSVYSSASDYFPNFASCFMAWFFAGGGKIFIIMLSNPMTEASQWVPAFSQTLIFMPRTCPTLQTALPRNAFRLLFPVARSNLMRDLLNFHFRIAFDTPHTSLAHCLHTHRSILASALRLFASSVFFACNNCRRCIACNFRHLAAKAPPMPECRSFRLHGVLLRLIWLLLLCVAALPRCIFKNMYFRA